MYEESIEEWKIPELAGAETHEKHHITLLPDSTHARGWTLFMHEIAFSVNCFPPDSRHQKFTYVYTHKIEELYSKRHSIVVIMK